MNKVQSDMCDHGGFNITTAKTPNGYKAVVSGKPEIKPIVAPTEREATEKMTTMLDMLSQGGHI